MTRFIPLFVCILLGAKSALSQEAFRPFAAGRFDTYLNADFFNSTANFDSNGSKQDLITNASLRSIGTSTAVRYLFWERLGIYSGLFFNNLETNNGVTARSNSILTYYMLGSDFQIFHNLNWNLYADVNYKISNENIEVSGDAAIASDGANEVYAGVVASYENEDWRIYAKSGIDYRMEGLSTLLKYGVGSDYAFGSLRLGLNFEGLSTVHDDEKTSTPIDRDLVTTRVNAGSRKFFAINPNSLEGQLYASYAIDKDLIIKVFGGSTMIGSNAAQGISAGVAFNWGFGASKRIISPNDVPNKTSFPDDEPGFKVDTNDGVNQELFKPVNPKPVPNK